MKNKNEKNEVMITNDDANNANNNKSGIVIARKGDSGYIKQMDLDDGNE